MSTRPELEYRQRVDSILRAYRPAQVLIACAELGVFETLGTGQAFVAELAPRVGAEPRALMRLLNTAVALGLLVKQGEQFSNSPMSLACLAAAGPYYLGNFVKREGAFYRRWGRLTEAVQTGRRPLENVTDEKQVDWVRDFELALYDLARTAAPAIAEALAPFVPSQGQVVRVIDIGGGHGAYSIALAQRYPNLKAVVFELPPVVEVTQEFIAAAGIGDRVSARAGDFKTDPLGSDYGLALLFGVLVSEPPQDALALLRKVYQALTPGGHVVIRGFYLEADRSGPPEAALFDLQMLLSTDAGNAHTIPELTRWLEEAGFEPPETVAVPAPERSALLVARKPGA